MDQFWSWFANLVVHLLLLNWSMVVVDVLWFPFKRRVPLYLFLTKSHLPFERPGYEIWTWETRESERVHLVKEKCVKGFHTFLKRVFCTDHCTYLPSKAPTNLPFAPSPIFFFEFLFVKRHLDERLKNKVEWNLNSRNLTSLLYLPTGQWLWHSFF